MKYTITGKQIDIGDSLQQHVKAEIAPIIEKYAERPTSIQVIFSQSAYEYVCEIILHLSTGMNVQVKAHTTEIYAAFSRAAEKLEKRLRRYKRRLKNYHKTRTNPHKTFSTTSYVLASSETDSEPEPEEAETEDLHPIVIAEMKTTVPVLTVGEAVMQIELSGARLLLFRNAKAHDRINIVYWREDGNIGWIDPIETDKDK